MFGNFLNKEDETEKRFLKKVEDETEKRLKAERDNLKEQLRAKQDELDEYRNRQENNIKEAVLKQYNGKILRIKQYWRGLSPLNKHELIYRYYFLYVTGVRCCWETAIEFEGRVLDVNMNPDGFDAADHIVDRGFEKVDFSVFTSHQIRVDLQEIEREYTEDEVREIVKRVREAQDEMVKSFLEGDEK
jgi:hypothetical protein